MGLTSCLGTKAHLGMSFANLGMSFATRLGMDPRLGAQPTDSPGKGGADDGVRVPDERRHPGQEDAEVQQDVEGRGDRRHDEHDPRVVEPIL